MSFLPPQRFLMTNSIGQPLSVEDGGASLRTLTVDSTGSLRVTANVLNPVAPGNYTNYFNLSAISINNGIASVTRSATSLEDLTVITHISASVAGEPSPTRATVQLIIGATIVGRWQLKPLGGSSELVVASLNIPALGENVTLNFDAPSGPGFFQTVNLFGYRVFGLGE